MFGLDYYHPKTTDAFLATYQTAINNQRHAVIKVTTEREKNYSLHQALNSQIVLELQKHEMPLLPSV
ncbi:MAG: hypothetical protein PUP92_06900 [Rhizonema sp. PD38]|nr:hypothetical protein [Rhizonema sp. PD38]